MLIYITHPQHGAMHVYSEDELRRHQAWGWSRAEMPTAKVAQVTIEVQTPSVTIETVPDPKRKPGRPKKGA